MWIRYWRSGAGCLRGGSSISEWIGLRRSQEVQHSSKNKTDIGYGAQCK